MRLETSWQKEGQMIVDKAQRESVGVGGSRRKRLKVVGGAMKSSGCREVA